MTFATVASDNGILHDRINCHSCGQRGHFADHCPVTSNEGANGNGGAASQEGNIFCVAAESEAFCHFKMVADT